MILYDIIMNLGQSTIISMSTTKPYPEITKSKKATFCPLIVSHMTCFYNILKTILNYSDDLSH